MARGFAPGESVLTLNSAGLMSFHLTVVAQTPETILFNMAEKFSQILLSGDGAVITKGPEMSPQLVISPVIARTLAAAGYSRQDVQRYIYEHSKVSLGEFNRYLALQGIPDADTCVERGLLPPHFAESNNTERKLPLFHAPEELQVIVAGTAERNRFFVTQNVARQGLATSKKINMELLKDVRLSAAENKQ